MPTSIRLWVTLAFVGIGFVLLFLAGQKEAGTGLILAAAASLGIGGPPGRGRRRPAGPAGRQSSRGTRAG